MSGTAARAAGGGRVSVRHNDGVSVSWPAGWEITDRAEQHYRDASQFLAVQVERGRAPWMVERGGRYALPEGMAGTPYRGPAAVWLAATADSRGYSDPRWGTEEKIAAAGGRVRSGEDPAAALTWRFGGRDERTGETWETRVFRRPVYNAEQCEGLPARDPAGSVWYHHPSPEKVLAVPRIAVSAGRRARYDLGRDRIELPDPDRFADRQAYYRIALHEVGHWTGHPSRLNRETLADGVAGGHSSRAYAREELRAEIHSYLTGSRLGLGHDPSRHARFAAEWAKALRENPREFYLAAHSAERISRYVTARVPEMQPARPASSPGRSLERPGAAPERDPGRGR